MMLDSVLKTLPCGKNLVAATRASYTLVLFLLQVFMITPLFAQVSGTVTDSKTKKPVAEVEVFIQGTTHSAISNEGGLFELQDIHPGFYDLVLCKKGYTVFKSSIRLQAGKAYALNLSINQAQKDKAKNGKNENSEQVLQRLKEAIVGRENEASFIILNVEALSLTKDNNGVSVKSSEPLMINNFSLGYQMRYFFRYCLIRDNKVEITGCFYFIPMQATGSDQDREWTADRLKAYQGSARHFFKAMTEGKTEQEGFQCFEKIDRPINASAMIAPSSISGYNKIVLPDTVLVTFRSNEGKVSSSRLLPHGLLTVNGDGILLKSENLEMSGSMKYSGEIGPLPMDYEPVIPKDENFIRFYEKTYVHTDKPYYYPGEPLWFKGYVNYYVPSWRDSLSRVLYVELINAKKSIVLSKMLKIDSGFYYGDFILSDSLAPGSYYLRAYTNLNRNFGNGALFIKPIPVLNLTDKVDRVQEAKEIITKSPLVITSDKATYKTRERIRLTFQLNDPEGHPLASNLSVSVTDAEQVVPVPEASLITNEFPLGDETKVSSMDFKYGAEFGTSFLARFLNDKGKPEKTTLNILQMKTNNMMLAETDEEGIFWRTGLQFYDSASFSFKSDKAQGRPYGKVELLPRETPDVDFRGSRLVIDVSKTEVPQRLISEYEVPKDTRLLEAVTIKGAKINEKYGSESFRSHYGTPDRVIKGEDVNMKFDLLYALVGKVPGLTVVPSTGVVVFSRAVGSSITLGAGPLVTVNDVPMEGDAGDVLRNINPTTVERIAITKRIDVLYGSQGKNGVIAVYTKIGTTGFEDAEKEKNFQILRIPGYSRPRSFSFPDYGDSKTDKTRPDYRATIYWNPWVTTDDKTGTASVSFYSADLEGRYRVVAEGVTKNGKPVRYVYFLVVDNQ